MAIKSQQNAVDKHFGRSRKSADAVNKSREKYWKPLHGHFASKALGGVDKAEELQI